MATHHTTVGHVTETAAAPNDVQVIGRALTGASVLFPVEDSTLSPVIAGALDVRGVGRFSVARGLFRTARPKQWVKNLLVFAAPGASAVLIDRRALAESLLAFAIFCIVASGTYFLNDAFDLEADRHHPTKRLRPIPAGVISLGLARAVGAALLLAGLGVSAVLGGQFLGVITCYIALQFAYSFWLKKEPILDLAAVSAGFVLRAIAGGVATGVPISEWFLIVATFASLFIVTAKRSSEHTTLADERGAHRATLDVYTPSFLRHILILSSTVAVTAYCLWAFESQRASHGGLWYQISIVPFSLAMLRYAFLVDQGQGGAPEDVILSDRTLQILGLLWVGTFALGVYG